ncbi:transposase [Pseudoduganella sp. LjRoot289]|uniref:transposase n=1 Tax=Pseudoduganella sp. LjRoot289 TaxID=3342314 RepID=UPI003ECC46B5
MARTPRLHFSGAFYHVMLRGNDKRRIFSDDADRYKLEELVADGVGRFGHKIHAYCWMENHIHLAIEVADIPLSKIMHNLSFRYTRYFNWRHQHVGHLFQGRYKALLIDSDSYLLQLIRYIHQNPVRAGITVSAADYAWSSHRDFLGLAATPWIFKDWALAQFAVDSATAIQRYAQFMGAEPDTQESPDFKRERGGRAIVGEGLFKQEALKSSWSPSELRRESLLSICAAVCLAAGISELALCSGSGMRQIADARRAVVFLAKCRRQCSLVALGAHLGRDASTLSRQLQKMLAEKPDCAARVIATHAEEIMKNARMQA